MLFVQHFTALTCLTARKDRVRGGAHVVSPCDAVNLLVLVDVNPQVTEQVPKASRPLQDSYLHQFGGSGKNSKGVKETLARHPLRSRALKPWFHALSYVVDIAPAQAHAIVSQHASLGQLMAIYADPSRCSRVLYIVVVIITKPPPSLNVKSSPKPRALNAHTGLCIGSLPSKAHATVLQQKRLQASLQPPK